MSTVTHAGLKSQGCRTNFLMKTMIKNLNKSEGVFQITNVH